jgi:hypothetical protein
MRHPDFFGHSSLVTSLTGELMCWLDLNGQTLIGLKRLMDVVEDVGGR